ncbi:HAMP domain-containing protein [Actinomadura decatromicini]|uniref:histidine kinase n=1 Tax=Actinomadura decatromicini TaxID=2604572 RepID=A0A5D3F5V3_9ACTN|nr:HAMP domain-containing protein [Actinomadura decatromicini]
MAFGTSASIGSVSFGEWRVNPSGVPVTKSEATGGTHGRPRTHPIWRRIALLLAVPLTALLVQWGIPAVVTLSNALQRYDYSTVYNEVGVPATTVTEALQDERTAAVRLLTDNWKPDKQRYDEQVADTDAAVAAFRKRALSAKTRDAMDGSTTTRVRRLSDAYDELVTLRARVAAGATTTIGAINGYSKVADNTIRLLTTLVSVDDVTTYQHTNALLHNYWARELMLREDALLSTLRGGPMSATNRTAFASYAEGRRQFFELGRTEAEGTIEKIMYDLANSSAFTTYTTLENSVVNNGLAPDPREWRSAISALSPVWFDAAAQAQTVVNNDDVKPAGRRIMLGFYLIGVIGLVSLIVSVALSLLFARRLTAELRALQESAQRLANERLPRVVAKLRRGETVDVEAESPPPATGRTREIVSVSEAFGTVQRTAVGTAVGEAELRASINRVFINLSWRSQSLLHRQLRLLDQMERRAAGPDELDDLFRLDHLTTRMRRHAEGLVILAGSPTVRAWDHPVAAEDVVRAAVAEIEDYTRVEVTGASSVAVSGDVVADVIHLLAELIENAAVFSPPATEVTVKVETVANGLAVEIVDRGIGLHPDELEELNTRLTSAAEFDLVDTERLGLFVVARLAARHRIKVSLQASAYGGTTAIVLVPHALVTIDDDLSRGGPAPGTARTLVAAFAGGGTAPTGRQRLGRPSRPALPGGAAPAQAEPPDDLPGDLPPGEPPMAVPASGSPYEPPTSPYDTPASPYEPPVPPYDAPASPYDPPTSPYDPPASPYDPPASPYFTPEGPRDAPGGQGGRVPAAEVPGQIIEAEVESSEVTGRLPRRVRQKNLAPQLRKGSGSRRADRQKPPAPTRPAGRGPTDDDFEEPVPELSRDLMSSLQSGWLRGRGDDDEPDDPGQLDEWGER